MYFFVHPFIEQRPRIIWLGQLYKAFRYVVHLNLFPSIPATMDPFELRIQRLSTRTFMFSFIFSFIILLIYTATAPINKWITLVKPTAQQYYDLVAEHEQTLICPCSQISTTYETFMKINYSLHPVCGSFYLKNQWIELMFASEGLFWSDDFRLVSIFTFQALNSFCQLATYIIENTLKEFYSTLFVSVMVDSKALFGSQMDAAIRQFITMITNDFSSSLRMIRDTTQTNALLTVLMTNYGLVEGEFSDLITSYTVYYSDDCVCGFNSSCIGRTAIFQNFSRSQAWYVPAFYRGCMVIEALRQSNLEPFFNQTFLEQLIVQLKSRVPIDLPVLDSSLLVRFLRNTTLGLIIDSLMVVDWNWLIHHHHYYTECQPNECTYQVLLRNNAAAILTILIGLTGGLITALRLIIPRTISIAMRSLRFIKRNIIGIETNSMDPTETRQEL